MIVEFVLARLTRLDMSRFLAWHCANLGAYEELLAEFSTVDTPLSNSPPYIQLMVLVAFNTAIFVGSALIQKAFRCIRWVRVRACWRCDVRVVPLSPPVLVPIGCVASGHSSDHLFAGRRWLRGCATIRQ